MSLLNEIAKWIPVADVPELLIRLFLPGDVCLHGDDDTLDAVFTTTYRIEQDLYQTTYLDPYCKIEHSFHDQPSFVGSDGSLYWFRNGLNGRKGNKSGYAKKDVRIWYYQGEMVMWKHDNVREWFRKNSRVVRTTRHVFCQEYATAEDLETALTEQVNKWIQKYFL